jgi:hypothetical protein
MHQQCGCLAQVVAGINYFLKANVSDVPTNDTYLLSYTVWSRPWLEASNAEDAWQLTGVSRIEEDAAGSNTTDGSARREP